MCPYTSSKLCFSLKGKQTYLYMLYMLYPNHTHLFIRQCDIKIRPVQVATFPLIDPTLLLQLPFLPLRWQASLRSTGNAVQQPLADRYTIRFLILMELVEVRQPESIQNLRICSHRQGKCFLVEFCGFAFRQLLKVGPCGGSIDEGAKFPFAFSLLNLPLLRHNVSGRYTVDVRLGK